MRIGPRGPSERELVKAYEGDLQTPGRTLRLLNAMGDVLLTAAVHDLVTRVRIYLSDLEEPDEIFITAAGVAADS